MHTYSAEPVLVFHIVFWKFCAFVMRPMGTLIASYPWAFRMVLAVILISINVIIKVAFSRFQLPLDGSFNPFLEIKALVTTFFQIWLFSFRMTCQRFRGGSGWSRNGFRGRSFWSCVTAVLLSLRYYFYWQVNKIRNIWIFLLIIYNIEINIGQYLTGEGIHVPWWRLGWCRLQNCDVNSNIQPSYWCDLSICNNWCHQNWISICMLHFKFFLMKFFQWCSQNHSI